MKHTPSAAEVLVWRFLRQNPGHTADQVRVALGMREAGALLRRLVLYGFARVRGEHRTRGYWAVGRGPLAGQAKRTRTRQSTEYRVWRFLQRHPWAKPSEVRTALRLRWPSRALRALVRKGNAVAKRDGAAYRYQATGIAPTDLRGTAPGSLAVLAAKQQARRADRSNHEKAHCRPGGRASGRGKGG